MPVVSSRRDFYANTQLTEQFFHRMSAHFQTFDLLAPTYIFLRSVPLKMDLNTQKLCPGDDPFALAESTQSTGPFLHPNRHLQEEWRSEERLHSVVRYYGYAQLEFLLKFTLCRLDKRGAWLCAYPLYMYINVKPSTHGMPQTPSPLAIAYELILRLARIAHFHVCNKQSSGKAGCMCIVSAHVSHFPAISWIIAQTD